MITSKARFVILTIVILVKLSAGHQRISEKKCKGYESLTQIPFYAGGHLSFPVNEIVTDQCKHNSIPLVIGGAKASIHEFPHQALLGFKFGRRIEWPCGGSILSSNFILTAAHCVAHSKHGNVSLVKVGMLKRLEASSLTSTYGVAEIFQHPEYERKTINNDFALLRINGEIKFNDKIYPICLPSKQHDDSEAIVTGFGKTGYQHVQSDPLLKVGLQWFSFDECHDLYPMKRLNRSTMICYGHRTESKDACEGDSGGPVQVLNNAISKCTYTQIGIVSFGLKNCGQIGYPGVFANVFYYLDWIEGIVWKDEV